MTCTGDLIWYIGTYVVEEFTYTRVYSLKEFMVTGNERFGLILIFLGVIAFSFTTLLSQSNGPRSICREPSWDFGYLVQKSVVSHTFYLHNEGSEPLTVEDIEVDCSCASATDISEPIPPEDSAAITLTFKSGRYRGIVAKSAKIKTNDPDRPVSRLRLRSQVIRDSESPDNIAVEPLKLKWKIEDSEWTLKADTVFFVNEHDSDFEPRIVHLTKDIVGDLKFGKTLGVGDTLAAVFSPTDKAPQEIFEGGSVTFMFEGQDTTIVTIPIELED